MTATDTMAPSSDGGTPQARRSAVVFADLVESVRLFNDFENNVIARWYAYTALVRDRLVVQHRGRLVRVAGDGLLLEFGSAPDAAQAALALHAALVAFNQGQPEGAAFWLRAGVHIADVVPMPHELFGAGVNIAARLASLAQPGQTLATAQVRHELADGVHARVHDLGIRFVKHLDDPLRVFLLEPPGQEAHRVPMAPSKTNLRPTVAVVPFVAMPADVHHDALGHAMADDVIASLARHPALRVLTRASTALIRNSQLDHGHLREALGAAFLLTGRFYVQDQRVRLSAELCELETGTVLWTGRTVGQVGAIFEGTDDLVPQLVTQIAQQVTGHELKRARSLPMDTLSSYTLFMGASGLLHSLVKADFDHGLKVLEHLVERHPRQAAPLALLARGQVFCLEQGWTDDRQRAGQNARELCERALERDPTSAPALAALAQICINFEGDVSAGQQLNERAIALDPSHATGWSQLSGALAFLGQGQAACDAAEECLRVSPLDPALYLHECYAAMAYLSVGDYGLASQYAASSVRQHSLHAPGLHLLVGALWLNGQQEAATKTAARYLSLFPKANAGTRGKRRLGAEQSWRRDFEEAIVSAGIPP